MVAVTISLDDRTYRAVTWYMDENDGMTNLSMAIRALIKKGLAHDQTLKAKAEADKTDYSNVLSYNDNKTKGEGKKD